MSSQEEQLIQFFAYSFFVYPVTNWLVSQPQKVAALPKQRSNDAAADLDAVVEASIDRNAEKKKEKWQKWNGKIATIVRL